MPPTQALSETLYWARVERERAREAWWVAYATAKDSSADIGVWLDGHPFPGSPEAAETVRRHLGE